ncbi:DUF523 domain-containing protein [Profundibacter sp.]|uniref:DUF523 domain-containing protein n=1 Tax=Profundibacter sp. TaxID=3101071 RepID=UPI003D0D34EA
MDKILISACLMGDPVRYDGRAKTSANPHLARWQAQGRLIPHCPEVAGGLPTPRLPAEIETGAISGQVLTGKARIYDSAGADVTRAFLEGAKATLAIALANGCRHAVLTDGSPSCGTSFIYAGHFDGRRTAGMGVTAALLQSHGIRVWNDTQIDELAALLDRK